MKKHGVIIFAVVLVGTVTIITGRVLGSSGGGSGSTIKYVDAGATGGNDGSSWVDAFDNLQDALAAASSGAEIRVADGAFKPDRGDGNTAGAREATFQLIWNDLRQVIIFVSFRFFSILSIATL